MSTEPIWADIGETVAEMAEDPTFGWFADQLFVIAGYCFEQVGALERAEEMYAKAMAAEEQDRPNLMARLGIERVQVKREGAERASYLASSLRARRVTADPVDFALLSLRMIMVLCAIRDPQADTLLHQLREELDPDEDCGGGDS